MTVNPVWIEMQTADLNTKCHELEVSTNKRKNNSTLYKSYLLCKKDFGHTLTIRF
jgi:hypothetical protein